MSRFLTYLGLITTLIYSVAVFVLIGDRLSSLGTIPLNEMGDFLAGAFGPLALLWLILGYLQQGIELKLNTKALGLQVEELKNSVIQQRELVEVSRKQFETDLELLRHERHRVEQANKPRFVAQGVGGTHHGSGRSVFSLAIKNLGASITNVTIQFNTPMQKVEPSRLSHWLGDETVRLQFTFPDWKASDTSFTIAYTDASGQSGEKLFNLVATLRDPHPHLEVVRPDL